MLQRVLGHCVLLGMLTFSGVTLYKEMHGSIDLLRGRVDSSCKNAVANMLADLPSFRFSLPTR